MTSHSSTRKPMSTTMQMFWQVCGQWQNQKANGYWMGSLSGYKNKLSKKTAVVTSQSRSQSRLVRSQPITTRPISANHRASRASRFPRELGPWLSRIGFSRWLRLSGQGIPPSHGDEQEGSSRQGQGAVGAMETESEVASPRWEKEVLLRNRKRKI